MSKKTLRIASSDPLSTFHAQAADLGEVLKADGLIDATEVIPSTGSVANAGMVARGEADIGFMASNWVPRATGGEAPFEAPLGIAIAGPLNAGPLFFVARADSRLETVADLPGRRVAVGHADSGMAQHARNIAETLGWDGGGADFAYLSTFDGGGALAEGTVDAQLQAPIPNHHFRELCERLAIKVLRFSGAEIKALCHAYPFYFPATVPAEFVPGLIEDVPALGVLNVVVVAADADEDFVAGLAAAYMRNAEALETRNPLFRGLPALIRRMGHEGREAVAPGGTPLHPGAARAYREAGLLSGAS